MFLSIICLFSHLSCESQQCDKESGSGCKADTQGMKLKVHNALVKKTGMVERLWYCPYSISLGFFLKQTPHTKHHGCKKSVNYDLTCYRQAVQWVQLICKENDGPFLLRRALLADLYLIPRNEYRYIKQVNYKQMNKCRKASPLHTQNWKQRTVYFSTNVTQFQ